MEKISSPRSRDIKTHVDCDLETEGGAVVPFTAMPTDSIGAEIFTRAIAGEFGKIDMAPQDGEYRWENGDWVLVANNETLAVAEATEKQSQLLQQASSNIAPLQDAVDLKMATYQEKAALTAWKKYRVLLARVVPGDAPDITWPEVPENVA